MRAYQWALVAGLCFAVSSAGCGGKKKESNNTNNCLTADACCVLAKEAGDESNTKGADDCVGEDLGGDKWCDDAATLAKNALNADEKDGECILKLKPMVSTRVPVLWINSTNSSEVAEFDSTTGEEIVRAKTWGSFPNRTAVAPDGSVWITNRNSYQYIHIDTNGDVVCASEYGINQGAPAAVDNANVGQARAATIDSDGNAWIGFNNTPPMVVKVSSTETDGTVTLTDPTDNTTTLEAPKCKELKRIALTKVDPYGLVADGDGTVWATAGFGPVSGGYGHAVAKIDAKTDTLVGEYDLYEDPKFAVPAAEGGLANCMGSYGMTIDLDGNPWLASQSCNNLVKIDKATGLVALVATTPADLTGFGDVPALSSPGSVGIDSIGHIWAPANNSSYVYEFAPDGEFIKAVKLTCPDTMTDGSDMLGVGSDIDGNMWVVFRGASRAIKFTTAGEIVGCYPAADADPPLNYTYTYSDLTGSLNALVASQLGKWRAIVEQKDAVQWALVSYKAKTPANTSVCVRVRAADTKAALKTAEWSASLCEGKDVLGYTVHALNDKDMKIVGKTKLLEVELQLSSSKKDADPPQVSDLSVGALTSK